MPLSTIVDGHPLLEFVLRLRRNPVTGYGAALAAIASATLVRSLLNGEIAEGIPFITYYPAIVITALVGGLWPGILATVLSVVIAWYLYLPPSFTFDIGRQEIATLLLFVFVSGVNVAVVALLNAAVERLVGQE